MSRTSRTTTEDLPALAEGYRVLLVCSSGGHLAQLMRLRSWWEGHERTWACFPLPDAEAAPRRRATWCGCTTPPRATSGNLMRNLVLSRCGCSGASDPT